MGTIKKEFFDLLNNPCAFSVCTFGDILEVYILPAVAEHLMEGPVTFFHGADFAAQASKML